MRLGQTEISLRLGLEQDGKHSLTVSISARLLREFQSHEGAFNFAEMLAEYIVKEFQATSPTKKKTPVHTDESVAVQKPVEVDSGDNWLRAHEEDV
jgi:hypothetical protein